MDIDETPSRSPYRDRGELPAIAPGSANQRGRVGHPAASRLKNDSLPISNRAQKIGTSGPISYTARALALAPTKKD